jgi:hypothetical protein
MCVRSEMNDPSLYLLCCVVGTGASAATSNIGIAFGARAFEDGDSKPERMKLWLRAPANELPVMCFFATAVP